MHTFILSLAPSILLAGLLASLRAVVASPLAPIPVPCRYGSSTEDVDDR